MKIEFDEAKDRGNIANHGISLARAVEPALLVVKRDNRFDYGEERFRAWGTIEGECFALAFTIRGDRVRPISLRRARQEEVERHVATKDD